MNITNNTANNIWNADTIVACNKYWNIMNLMYKLGVSPCSMFRKERSIAYKIASKAQALWVSLPDEFEIKNVAEMAANIKKARKYGRFISVLRRHGVSDTNFRYNWEDGFGRNATQRFFDKIRNIPYRTMQRYHEALYALPFSVHETLF